ncbi:MAG: diacylglycerol kinase family protein [Candidatus Saccharimonadales bacterium]
MPPKSSHFTEAMLDAKAQATLEPRLDLAADLADYDQLVVFANPAAGRAGEIDGVMHGLNSAGLHLEIDLAETSPDISENQTALRGLSKKCLWAVHGGDGTLSVMCAGAHAIEGFQNPGLVLAGGSKNDLARQVNDSRSLKNPAEALRRGRIAPLNPIEFNINYDNPGLDPLQRLAFAYSSLGVTGQVIRDVNDPDYKQRKIHKFPGGTRLADAAISLGALTQAESFWLHPGDDEMPQPAIDVIAVNGSRMAGSFRPRVGLHNPEARIIISANRLRAVGVVACLSAGLGLGQKLGQNDEYITRITGATGNYLQIDGDELPVRGDGQLGLKIAERGIKIITTHR